MFRSLPAQRRGFGPTLLSAGAHAGIAAAWLLSLRVHPVHVFTLPGTASGSRIAVTYLPGHAPARAVVRPTRVKVPTAPAAPKPPTQPLAESPQIPDATGSDSWGSGSIQIALTTFSPSPAPDLSALPHGVQGDVVVDVTIDPNGRVADLAVLRTLGYGIESSVIGTLRTWTFRPATKDGSPIASVQELHFHFGPV